MINTIHPPRLFTWCGWKLLCKVEKVRQAALFLAFTLEFRLTARVHLHWLCVLLPAICVKIFSGYFFVRKKEVPPPTSLASPIPPHCQAARRERAGRDLLLLVWQSRAQQGKALSSQQSSLPPISLLNTALSETSFCSLKQSGINSVNIKFQARIRAQTQGDVSKCSSHNRVTWPCSRHVRGLPKGPGLRLCTHHPRATPAPRRAHCPGCCSRARGMLKLVCLAGWKGKTLPVLPKEDRLVQQHHLCEEGMKSQPGGGRQHSTSVAQDCQHGRFTSTSQKGATTQHGAQPRYRLIQYAPLSASGSNPHPQDQAVSPALSTRQSCLSRHSPQGCGTSAASAFAPGRASSLAQHGTAWPAEGVSFAPQLHESRP